MAKPNNSIAKVKLPGESTERPIIPNSIGSSTHNYIANLPSDMASDDVIALSSDIPTVNNGKLIIQGSGTTASEFTANSSSDVTLNIKGSGATSVSRTASNEITISSTAVTDTNQKIKQGSVTFGNDDVVNFVGGGNITITGDASAKTMTLGVASGYSIPSTTNQTAWTNKQDALVSGTNIKTINNTSLLGSGNISFAVPSIGYTEDGNMLLDANGNYIVDTNGDYILTTEI